MEKVRLGKYKIFRPFVSKHSKYFTHRQGRFLATAKWEEKGFSVFSFGKDISIKYNRKKDLIKALDFLTLRLAKAKKGIIKIRKRE